MHLSFINNIKNTPVAALFLRYEVVLYLVIVSGGFSMRLWDLGSRAMGYDESLHAYYSYLLSEGFGFQHTPVMHGPFLFHVSALAFFFLGDSDLVARLMPVIFGTVLIILPWFLRTMLGRIGSLTASALLAFSPMMLFYSRYARNDIFMAVWTLAIVVLMWRFIEEKKNIYLYMIAMVLALAFTTKETTFIVVAIFGSYLFIVSSPDWMPWIFRRQKKLIESHISDDTYRYIPGYGFRSGSFNIRHRLSKFSSPGILLLLFGTLTLPQAAATISLFDVVFSRFNIILANNEAPIGAPSGQLIINIQGLTLTTGMIFASIWIMLLILISCALGISWNRTVWFRCASIFYCVWLLLYTSLMTNLVGIGSGIWQGLGYWILQHEVNRGDQPWYYYIMVLPVYEALPFLLSVIACIYYIFRGDRFSRFLVYWTIMSLLLYSIAGEKMPWLVVNIVLPMIIITGKFIGDLMSEVEWEKVRSFRGIYLMPATILLIYLAFRLILYQVEPDNLMNFMEFWTLSFIMIAVLGLSYKCIVSIGLANAVRVVMLSVTVLLFVFGIRSAWHANYINGDIAKEMLTYAQGSNEVPVIMQKVSDVAIKQGSHQDIKLIVDRDIYWGLVWYTRNFESVEYADMDTITSPDQNSIVLVGEANRSYMDKYASQFDSKDFLYLWWPSEGYKPCEEPRSDPCFSPLEFFPKLLDRDKIRETIDYLIYRRTNEDFLYHKATVYFPN